MVSEVGTEAVVSVAEVDLETAVAAVAEISVEDRGASGVATEVDSEVVAVLDEEIVVVATTTLKLSHPSERSRTVFSSGLSSRKSLLWRR